MNLGDVARRVVPKMTLIGAPREGGTVTTRTFIPHVCHEAIGVLGAVSVATACVVEGTVAFPLCASAARRAQDRVGRAPDRRIHGRARNEVGRRTAPR